MHPEYPDATEVVPTQTRMWGRDIPRTLPVYNIIESELQNGARIQYQHINVAELQKDPELLQQLVTIIVEQVESPVFSQYSDEMWYREEDFSSLLSRTNTLLILAWKNGQDESPDSARSSRLIGYLVAEPFHHGDITPEDVTTRDGRVLRMPTEGDTWIFDSFAVLDAETGQGIGSTLIKLMLQEVIFEGSPYKRLVTFAVAPDSLRSDHQERGRAFPYTRSMLTHHALLNNGKSNLLIDEEIVPYRGAKAWYMWFDINLDPTRQAFDTLA